MKKIEIVRYFNIGTSLEVISDSSDMSDKDEKIGDDSRRFLIKAITEMEGHLRQVEMAHTLALAAHVKTQIEKPDLLWRELKQLVDCILVEARTELSGLFCGYINADRARFWGQEKPFGEDVFSAFESTRKDITSAGNCYAIEQWDACVFHMMRAAERGIRAIAYERGIRRLKKAPIEWADWNPLIKAIRAKSDEIEKKLGRGPRRDKALDFYNGAVGEMYAFKDSFRNYVMHARPDSDNDLTSASSAYHRVGEFMKRLAKGGLSDTLKGAIKW